ncbi:uncharacterized protein LOC142761623 [Rhipicephalus microplus]|uniref:uncharacterized protein LOC142761623 n=1 Tax=Rhipicephalus microplus TaxID=6941 RepID=UPI003F6C2721
MHLLFSGGTMVFRKEIALTCVAAALVAVLQLSAAAAPTCSSDSDCSGGQRCVEHFNMSVNSNCDSYKYCIDVSDTSCSCSDGYTCRLMDCPRSPYECLYLEDTTHRCGASNAPVCKEDETCTYVFNLVFCYKCPCYGQFNVTCMMQSSQYPACGPNSIATLYGTEYTCDGCRSASTVLVAPN